MQIWVTENLDQDATVIYREVYDHLRDIFKNDINKIPQCVLILAEYQYKDAIVQDKEINLVAFLTEIMNDLF
jgi:hypothetical protein